MYIFLVFNICVHNKVVYMKSLFRFIYILRLNTSFVLTHLVYKENKGAPISLVPYCTCGIMPSINKGKYSTAAIFIFKNMLYNEILIKCLNSAGHSSSVRRFNWLIELYTIKGLHVFGGLKKRIFKIVLGIINYLFS